mmetsp:Transcript_16990/g.44984  ORF Transcript_16990/g.44984 Transcript_16990/m.44984 type:complete len:241 (+) Transcript_16990:557-1279(+)
MDGVIYSVVEGAVQRAELHCDSDLLWAAGVVPVVHLLQRLEPDRRAAQVDIHLRHPVHGREVDVLLHARSGGFAGLGRHAAVPGPPGHSQASGVVLIVHRPGLYSRVGALFQAQLLAVPDLCAALPAASLAAQRRHLLLGLHGPVESDGDVARAAADGEARAVPAALEDTHCSADARNVHAALPDIQHLPQHYLQVEVPVAPDRRDHTRAFPVRPCGDDVPLGTPQVQPEVRVLAPARRH